MASGIGIDSGTHTTRVAKVTRRGRRLGPVVTVAADTGPSLASPDLAQKLRDARVARRGAVVGLTGKETVIRYLHLAAEDVDRLADRIDDELNRDADADVSFDWRRLDLPAPADPDVVTVMAAVTKTELLADRLDELRRCGVLGADLAPKTLALHEVFARCPESEEALDRYCLVLDVGASETEMIVVHNGRLVFARPIAFGGRDFTSTLAKSLDIQADRAEHLKLAHGEVVDRKEIDQRPSAERPMLQALADAADEFHSAIKASLMFAETQTRLDRLPVGRIYLSGAGARLDGLRQFLARRFDVRASFLRAPDEWGAPGEPDQPGEWVIALGLALIGLQPPADRLSLLPPSVRRRRRFRRRDVFSYAAAALFLATAALAALGVARADRAKRRGTPARQQLLDKADSRERELRRLLEEVERTRARASRVMAAARAAPAFARLVEALRQARQGDAEVRTLTFETGGVDRSRPPVRFGIEGAVDPFAAEPAATVKAFADALQAHMPEPGRWTVSRETRGLDEQGRTRFVVRLRGHVPTAPAGRAEE